MNLSLKWYWLFILTLTGLLAYTKPGLKAQIPNTQDCLGAIPVCLGTYVQGNLITGTGNYTNEINAANSCLLTGERNDVWYIFTTSGPGNVSFSIIPVNPTHNYDWAIYNITSSVCSDIFTNPALEVACNYSNVAGTTGANGLPGAQNNPVIPVTAGQTFVINVSGFSSINQSGYTLDLTASTADITDNNKPTVASVTSMNCGATTMNVSFSERVLCSSVQASDFTLTGPGGPFTVNSVSGTACTAGAGYGRDYTISFSPAIPGAGNYSLNLVNPVTDLCSNDALVPQAFQVPISGINLSFQTIDVTCFAGNNGSATVNVTGPPGPYTYQWSPMGGNAATAQWLTAGTYTVTVTSALGCSASSSVQINQPLNGLTASVTTTPANGCAANGTATVTVSNGQPPFTYSWWPSGGNAATATGLTAGGYMVTITDANQCVLNYFLNVPSSNGPSVSISSSTNVSCNGGSDGSATVTVSNATGPFTYLWSPSGGTSATATGLSAGNYTVDVVVAPGCTLTASVTIVEPPTALVVNVNSTNTSCGNNNGSISLNASGGAGGYTYQWVPGVSSSNVANGLSGGNYTITVTDGNGCTSENNVNIQASTQPLPTLNNHLDVSCFGLSDGATGVTVTGGSNPISYLWSSGQTTASINNVPAGTYTVTVTDALGCASILTDVINQPSELTASIQNINHVLCFGDATGSATAVTGGGNGGNVFSWSGNISTTSALTNVTAGTYTVTVTDQLGCSASAQVIINEPSAPLSVTGTITETSCGNSDGSIATTVTGGTGSYQYVWNTGSTSASLNQLNPGVYSLTVTDQNGCSTQESFTLQASDAPVITIDNISNVLCNGNNDGSVNLSVSGGVAPYSWSWTGTTSTGSSAVNLTAGNYTASVTDNTGCTSFQQITITQPDPLNATFSTVDTICIGETASIAGNVTGGTTPYTYLWSNGSSNPQVNVMPTITTNFNLTVTDINGCIFVSNDITVPVNDVLQLSASYPDSVCRGNNAVINLTATGGDGNYNFTWSNNMSGGSNTLTVNQNISLIVTLSDGCSTPEVQTTIDIVAVNAPDITFALPVQTGCAPLETSFTFPSGGPSGLIYTWDFGDGSFSSQMSPDHTYNNAGVYSVTLTVAYGSAPTCSKVLSFPQTVIVYELPQARFIFDPPNPTLNNPEVFFKDRSTGAVNWMWDFGDGTTSQLQNPVYAYADTGAYVVTLQIQSQEGCQDTTANLVEVKDEMQVFIPNAFTPDASGINDYFKIYGVGFISYELMIFDRWGKLVYVSKNMENAWDGTDMSTGEPVPQGLYVYKVVITDNNGDVHNRFNHVTVIR